MIHGFCSLWISIPSLDTLVLSISLYNKSVQIWCRLTCLLVHNILENTLRQEDLMLFFLQTCSDWQLICTSQPRLHSSSIRHCSSLGLFDCWDNRLVLGRKCHRTECWATLYRGKNIEHDTRQHKIYAWLVYKYVKKRRNLHWVWVEAWERW